MVLVTLKIVIAADWYHTVKFILDHIEVSDFFHSTATVLDIQSMFLVWNSKQLERTEAWLCCRAQSFSAGLKVHCCFWQWLPSSCSVLLSKICCCCTKPAPWSSGVCCMISLLQQICFTNRSLQTGTALLSLGRYSEGHFCSQWVVGNQSFQRFYSNTVADTFLAVLWPWQARGRKGLPTRVSLGPVAREGGAWDLYQLPKFIENPAYVDGNSGEAFTKPVLTLSCSPRGFNYTRAPLEDLDAV